MEKQGEHKGREEEVREERMELEPGTWEGSLMWMLPSLILSLLLSNLVSSLFLSRQTEGSDSLSKLIDLPSFDCF